MVCKRRGWSRLVPMRGHGFRLWDWLKSATAGRNRFGASGRIPGACPRDLAFCPTWIQLRAAAIAGRLCNSSTNGLIASALIGMLVTPAVRAGCFFEPELGQVCSQPSVTLTSPANGAVYGAPAAIALSSNPAPTAGATIVRVEYYNGTSLLGTVTSAPWSTTWNGVGQGSYSVRARACDRNDHRVQGLGSRQHHSR